MRRAKMLATILSLLGLQTDGVVTSIWYNDPAGRLTALGKRRKIKLYAERFTNKGDWELRISNGWMLHLFNDLDRVHLVYGIHMDVIRINAAARSGLGLCA